MKLNKVTVQKYDIQIDVKSNENLIVSRLQYSPTTRAKKKKRCFRVLQISNVKFNGVYNGYEVL